MSKYKSGLDYFSFDIDFFNDEKIEFISAKFGIKGEIIIIKLLCKIYRNGYYLKWGEDECLLFSRKIGEGITVELINEVIKELFKRDFLNQDMFEKYQILTSRGIQKRYLEATKRRKEVVLYKEYFCLNNQNVNIISQNVNIIPLNVDILPQSKVKESKVKESIKEVVNQPFQETQKKKAKPNNIEYDFEAQCWYGLDDDILEAWGKKFPMLNIALELQDKLRGKFRLKPKYYQKLINTKYQGNFAIFIFDWLVGSKRFYLQDHPEYEQSIGRNVNHIKNVIKNLKVIKDRRS